MSSEKKITFLVSSLSGGGAENVCVNIANKFSENNWQVDLVVLNLINENYRSRLSDKVNLIILNVKNTRYSIISLLRYVYKSRSKTYLVFNHELAVVLIILRFFLKLKIRIVSRNISVLSIKIDQYKSGNFWLKNIVRPLIKNFYHKIDHVINQCNYMSKDLIYIYPKLINNSSVIFNPISKHILDYANKYDLNKIKKKNYLLCVGRLEEVKSFHYAIEGFAGISNKFPNLRLKIVGQGNLEKQLIQKALDLNISSRVDFEGFQKDIGNYYLYAKATVLTSLYEGYPNVLLESLAMNTPVVAFNCPGGTNEIVKDGLNGYLVKHQDVEDLKKKLSILLSNKLFIKDLNNTVDKNQIDEVFNQYEKLINSIIK